MNIVKLSIETEIDCDAENGEYTVYLVSSKEPMNLSAWGGTDDVSLAVEALENELDFSILPDDGLTTVELAESGEWEGMSWHKYFTLLKVGETVITPIEYVIKQAKKQKSICDGLNLRFEELTK